MMRPVAERPTGGHAPVMLREVLQVLQPRDGAIFVDGTFGAGGYSRALLDAANCHVYGIDRDPSAVERGRAIAEGYGGRLEIIEGRFGQMDSLVAERGASQVNGVALDLGVSSMQLDEPARGFSFRAEGPLDMRMSAGGESAADLVNEMGETELADIIHRYGEERRSRQVARAIVEARRKAPITTTTRLAEIVRAVVRKGHDGIDPATRTFQALRIVVNDELGEIDRGLKAAERLLAPGGRLAVVAFHSLEDRIVKEFLKVASGGTSGGSRHLPSAMAGPPPVAKFKLLWRGTRRPSAEECAANPRARSARLRAAERIASSDAEEARQ